MDVEKNDKIDMALKDIEKIKDVTHRLEKEQAVMDHKIQSLEKYLTEKIDDIGESIKSLVSKVEQGLNRHLTQPPAPETLREFLSKYSVTIQLAIITIIIFINPEVIKHYIMNSL